MHSVVVSFKLSQNVEEPEKGCSGYGRSDFRERRISFSLDFREIRSSGQEGKLLYITRPTRRLRFWEFSTNSVRYEFYPTCFNPYLSALLMLVLG